jgi:mRNA interferase MazF
MRRGEIRWVDLDPTRGSESDERRPGVIVSNDGANSVAKRLGRGVVAVIPVTSNVQGIHRFQVLLTAEATGLVRDSKAQAEQVRSVAVERVGERLGAVTGADLAALDEALRLHLALWSPTVPRCGNSSAGLDLAGPHCVA